MKNLSTGQAEMKFSAKLFLAGLMLFSVQLFAFESISAQAKKRKPAVKKIAAVKKTPAAADLPKVTQIDAAAFKTLLDRGRENTKPLLINFWATWCVPCREEFPDLVKIDADYKGKFDFITVSLDDASELTTGVPKFLALMKATMPAYLLKTNDEEAAIGMVSKDWQGALPFTILFNPKGETIYSKQGKIKPEVLRAEIEKAVSGAGSNSGRISDQQIHELPLIRDKYTYEKGVAEAKKDIAKGRLLILYYGFRPAASNEQQIKDYMKRNYQVETSDVGCSVPGGYDEYARGYNEISTAEIKRRFGTDFMEKAAYAIAKEN